MSTTVGFQVCFENRHSTFICGKWPDEQAAQEEVRLGDAWYRKHMGEGTWSITKITTIREDVSVSMAVSA